MKKILFALLFFSLAAHAEIIPFETDNCTMFPEGTRNDRTLWKHCCVEHDLFFWAGGSKVERLATDKQLRDCVAKTGQVNMAEIIYLGVRLGAFSPYHIKKKQWGNAWHDRAVYLKLTGDETSEVIDALERQDPELPIGLKDKFIRDLRLR